MRLKKGVKNLGEALREIPGVKRKEYGGLGFVFGDEHKLEFWGSGNRYFSELEIEEYRWFPMGMDDEEFDLGWDGSDWDYNYDLGWDGSDWDYNYDGLWDEVNTILLTVKK